jgi:hypothetical protein
MSASGLVLATQKLDGITGRGAQLGFFEGDKRTTTHVIPAASAMTIEQKRNMPRSPRASIIADLQ